MCCQSSLCGGDSKMVIAKISRGGERATVVENGLTSAEELDK